MPYVSLPPVPVVTPADYVARAPLQAKPPRAAVAPRPQAPAPSAHGPAVILGGALAKPVEGKADATPKSAATPTPVGRHIDRII